jgi:2,3-bisphosphoglycerate-dependent phosphoglycerate mutase
VTAKEPVKGTLVVLRHGQTDYNKQHLNTGRRDIPLNANGEAQADELGTLIRTPTFDKVYSSPLSRAFNTAARALKSAGTQKQLQNADGSWQIEKRPELIELDAGDFTGCRNLPDDPGGKPYAYDVAPPNGESIKDVVARVSKLYQAEILPRLNRGENVLISGHFFVVLAFEIMLGLREPPTGDLSQPKVRVPNASPLVCHFEDGVLKDHRYIQNPKTPPPSNKYAANQNAARAQKIQARKP